MRRFVFKSFLLGVALTIMWGIVQTYNKVTDGFEISQIDSTLPPCPQFDVTLSPERRVELQQILDQHFRYIGKGCQFYAFQSEDGKYVIKFLKHKHLRLYPDLEVLPMPRSLRNVCDEKRERRLLRVERLFSSCKLAYEEMPELTGLIYIHLNRTPALERRVTLIDRIGFKHRVDVDAHEFIIQKRAIPVGEAFTQEEEIPTRIQQLVDLVLARCEKGICDRDRSFVQNVAFGEGEALFIDIGQFYKDPAILSVEEQKKDLRKRLGNLHFWTERHFPEHLGHVEEQINQL